MIPTPNPSPQGGGEQTAAAATVVSHPTTRLAYDQPNFLNGQAGLSPIWAR
ncbi:MAG: hypothetical protein QOI12_1257 [Alphaproteobacteria bacterium]|jgi:hypothetical protein|nr:hypothetical protein [Alphaproteobacteria bacterium]